jgi:hypothetical protein
LNRPKLLCSAVKLAHLSAAVSLFQWPILHARHLHMKELHARVPRFDAPHLEVTASVDLGSL